MFLKIAVVLLLFCLLFALFGLCAAILSIKDFRHLRDLCCDEFEEIDIQLIKRYRLIEKLLDKYEGTDSESAAKLRESLQEAKAKRERVSRDPGEAQAMKSLNAAEHLLNKAVNSLRTDVDELDGGDGSLKELLDELDETEEHLQLAANNFNSAVTDYNNRRETFFHSTVASAAGRDKLIELNLPFA